jgi:hypothetical protein
MTDLGVQFRLKIPVVSAVVTGGGQRVGFAHLDLRSNRLRDYAFRDFQNAENCTLSDAPVNARTTH